MRNYIKTDENMKIVGVSCVAGEIVDNVHYEVEDYKPSYIGMYYDKESGQVVENLQVNE